MIDAQTIAFTGTANWPTSRSHSELVSEVIRNLGTAVLFNVVTGAAKGVDTLAAYYAYAYAPGHNVLVVPAAPHNLEIVKFAHEHFFEIIRLDSVPGGNSPNYMARNDKMIELADHLIAFPETSKEVLRSGTWATIRRARKKGIPIDIYPLNVVR